MAERLLCPEGCEAGVPSTCIAHGLPFSLTAPAEEDGDGVRTIGHLDVADIRPEDTLVMRSERPLTLEARSRIRETLEGTFPDCQVLVLSDGLELGIVRALTGQEEDANADT